MKLRTQIVLTVSLQVALFLLIQQGFKNGLFIDHSETVEAGRLGNDPVTRAENYTGVPGIDTPLQNYVSFFWTVVGPHAKNTHCFFLVDFLFSCLPVILAMYVEGSRKSKASLLAMYVCTTLEYIHMLIRVASDPVQWSGSYSCSLYLMQCGCQSTAYWLRTLARDNLPRSSTLSNSKRSRRPSSSALSCQRFSSSTLSRSCRRKHINTSSPLGNPFQSTSREFTSSCSTLHPNNLIEPKICIRLGRIYVKCIATPVYSPRLYISV